MRKRPGNPYDFKYEKNDEDLSLEDPFMYSVDPSYESPVDDENEYDMDQDQEDTPEGLGFEDEDETFQSKMRMSRVKPMKRAEGGWDKWKEEKPYSPIKSDDLPLDKYLEKKKTIKLKESDIYRMVQKVLREQENQRYMFFSNLEQIRRQCGLLLSMDENMIEEILSNGHDWAQDHIAEAKNNMDQVFDFLMNETKKDGMELSMDIEDGDMVSEGKKKAGTKLCARGKSAAKAKFKVYPSAYANGYAVQVCKGKMPGSDGKKRCSPPYC
jgi:hypothetical protein